MATGCEPEARYVPKKLLWKMNPWSGPYLGGTEPAYQLRFIIKLQKLN